MIELLKLKSLLWLRTSSNYWLKTYWVLVLLRYLTTPFIIVISLLLSIPAKDFSQNRHSSDSKSLLNSVNHIHKFKFLVLMNLNTTFNNLNEYSRKNQLIRVIMLMSICLTIRINIRNELSN